MSQDDKQTAGIKRRFHEMPTGSSHDLMAREPFPKARDGASMTLYNNPVMKGVAMFDYRRKTLTELRKARAGWEEWLDVTSNYPTPIMDARARIVIATVNAEIARRIVARGEAFHPHALHINTF